MSLQCVLLFDYSGNGNCRIQVFKKKYINLNVKNADSFIHYLIKVSNYLFE